MSEITIAVHMDEITPEQGRQLLEARAQRDFNMTLNEFAEAFEAGVFSTDGEDTAAEELAFLLPLAG